MPEVNFRKKIIQLAVRTKSRHCHIGSCLSCIDILTQILLYEMEVKDKFILSKGHAALALFVVLHHQKKLTDADLATYMQNGTRLGIHPPASLPDSIPLPTGSLGHGLSFSAGLAYGYKVKNPRRPAKVYCLISDGECNEGAVWEAALFASRHKLNNLIVLVDKNNFQAFGKIKEVLGDAAAREKWAAFGFRVFECNGNNLKSLKDAFAKNRRLNHDSPCLIICHTKRAKGLPPLEDVLNSNYTAVDEEMLNQLAYNNQDYAL